MTENLIGKLLGERMRAGGLSTRDVAAETGVAHTTVMRILQGKVVSVRTLQNISRFLEADPGSFISLPGDDEVKNVADDIATLIGREPQLVDVLRRAVAQVKAGEMSTNVLKEIVRYAAWRIGEREE